MINTMNTHAGHGKQDSKSCGSNGIVKESIENRLINNEFIKLMREQNKKVNDCTIDYPNSKNDCLNKIINKCNSNKVDLDISHHLNAGRDDEKGDSKTGGVEVWVYSNKGEVYEIAKRICNNISKLGFTNRGVKVNKEYAVLAKTKSPAMIIEYFFVDDFDDCKLYNKVGYKALAKAVAEAVLNKKIESTNNNSGASTTIDNKFKNGSYEGRYAIVTTDSLRVRYNRGTQYEKIGSVTKEQKVKLNWCQDGWISIYGYNGHKGLGYVSTEFLRLL